MLEFAVGSGVLLLAFAGTFQFGYAFLQYNHLVNAVARGARYASLAPYDSASTTPSSAFLNAVRNMVLYGSPSGGVSPVLKDVQADDVMLTVTFENGVPSAMTVFIRSHTINAVFTRMNLTNKPRVTYAYQGIWSPI